MKNLLIVVLASLLCLSVALNVRLSREVVDWQAEAFGIAEEFSKANQKTKELIEEIKLAMGKR